MNDAAGGSTRSTNYLPVGVLGPGGLVTSEPPGVSNFNAWALAADEVLMMRRLLHKRPGGAMPLGEARE